MTNSRLAPAHADRRPLFRLTLISWIVLTAAFLAAVLLVKSGMAQMVSWYLAPEYSYAPIIPFVSAFLIWQRRDQLERLPFSGSWLGLLLVLLGATLGFIGNLSAAFTLQHYSVLLALHGVALALAGRRAYRLLCGPLLILAFMVPLPTFLYLNLSAQLQLWSSQFGVWVIRRLGVSVYLEGNVIDLGAYKLQVVEACDGLRYLFPLMVIGFLLAYFFKSSFWKRTVLFASSIPITILMNSFRIGVIGVMVAHWGVRMAEGFLHEFQGWAVFMVSGALMVVEMTMLARTGPEARPWRSVFGLDLPAPAPLGTPALARPVSASLYASTAFLIVVAGISLSMPERTETPPVRSSFAQYPTVLGSWTGRRAALEPIYQDALMLDDYFLADFTRDKEPTIEFYVAWYDTQRAGRSVHSPRGCLPAGGWEVKSFSQRSLPGIVTDSRTLRVNRALIQKGTQRQLVYYWFQQRGRLLTNEYAVKWFLFWDALTRNRTDGALVRLVVPLAPGGTEAAADDELAQFAAVAEPALVPYIPD